MDVQEVIDKQAIKDLQVHYSISIDTGAYDNLDDVFLPDAVADYGHAGKNEGVQAIKRTCGEALDPLTSAQHQNGNHWAEISGDTARAGCYFTVHQYKKDTPGGEHFSMGGTYTDDLVRTPEGWRISNRKLEVLWSEGNRAVRFDR